MTFSSNAQVIRSGEKYKQIGFHLGPGKQRRSALGQGALAEDFSGVHINTDEMTNLEVWSG